MVPFRTTLLQPNLFVHVLPPSVGDVGVLCGNLYSRADGTSRVVVCSEFTTVFAGDGLWKTLRLTVRLWILHVPRRGDKKKFNLRTVFGGEGDVLLYLFHTNVFLYA